MASVTLVLLPGLDGTGLLFGPLVAALPAGVRAEVMRYPADRELTYGTLAAEVAAGLPRGGPFLLVGESFGGPLAVLLAAGRPAGLVGVVLCATFVTCPWPALGRLVRPLVRPLPFRLYPAYKRAVHRTRREPAPGSWAAAAAVSRLVRPAVIAGRVRMVLSVDVREALRACPVPILYLRGSHDRLVPAGNLRQIRAIRPDVSAVTIASSHQVLQKRPAETAAAMVEFVRRRVGLELID